MGIVHGWWVFFHISPPLINLGFSTRIQIGRKFFENQVPNSNLFKVNFYNNRTLLFGTMAANSTARNPTLSMLYICNNITKLNQKSIRHENNNITRMHSSRKRTARSSSHLGGGGLHQATVMAFWCGGLLLLLWPSAPPDHTKRLPSIRRPPNQKTITEDHNRRP